MITLYKYSSLGACKLNLEIEQFPDGSAHMNVCENRSNLITSEILGIDWKYDSDSELAQIIYLAKHIRNINPKCSLSLRMAYVPNARMDRVQREENVFTLKYFCEVINWLGFDEVYILDPHSDVAPALLDRVWCSADDVENKILKAKRYSGGYMELDSNEIILYYPDEGAAKKYSKIMPEEKYCYGKKIRDWDTGTILGLEIVNPYNIELKDKCVLIVDDIISYGGTMYFGAKKLKELGVKSISAYASHTENSVLNLEKSKILQAFDEDIIAMIYTTDSIYRGNHEKIEVI